MSLWAILYVKFDDCTPLENYRKDKAKYRNIHYCDFSSLHPWR